MSRLDSKGLIDASDAGTKLSPPFRSDDAEESSNLVGDGAEVDNRNESVLAKECADGDSEELENALTEDCYSLIYTSGKKRPVFCFAITMFLFQLWIQILIMIDLVSPNDSNWAKLPAGVDLQVEVAQILGLILIAVTIAVTGDITIGLAMILDGYDESVFDKNPWATRSTWLMSSIFQLIVGILMTLVFFLLLVQSTSTIALMLNFAALAFVQEIDELAFQLGKNGYLGSSIAEDCDRVSEHKIPRQKRKHRRLRPAVFCVLLSALIIPYFYLTNKRWSGDFVCQSINLQFGDGFVFQYGYFSGMFEIQNYKTYGRRHVYQDSSNRVKFAYCRDIGKWTLSFVAKDKKIDEKDSCEYHFMESPFATTYDLLDLQHETWKFFDFETFQYQPADRFYMECADCKDSNYGDNCFPELEIQFCEKIAGGETCRSERERECKEVNGKNVCVCNEKAGLFGMHCEFLEPCERLELDMRTKPFAGDESVLPTDFTVLRNPHNGISVVNYRPVYISNGYVFTDDQVGKVLLIYLGRRWAMTLDFFVFMRFDLCWKVNRFKNLGELVDLCDHPSSEDLTSFLDNEGNGAFDTTDAELEECYENFTEALEFETLSEEVEFHGAKIFFDLNCYCRFYTFIPYYMSAPLDIGTPSDSVMPEIYFGILQLQTMSYFCIGPTKGRL